MTNPKTDAHAEFSAVQTIFTALEPLDDEARSRVISSIATLLGITTFSAVHKSADNAGMEEGDDAALNGELSAATRFESFAELYDAAGPKTNPQKALLAGYWIQVCQAAGTFDGQSANTELKHQGEGIGNITHALNALKNQRPALALQLRKSGKSQQARKTYKLTVAGMKAVEDMING